MTAANAPAAKWMGRAGRVERTRRWIVKRDWEECGERDGVREREKEREKETGVGAARAARRGSGWRERERGRFWRAA